MMFSSCWCGHVDRGIRSFGDEEIVKEFQQVSPGFWAQFIVVMLVIFSWAYSLIVEIAVVVNRLSHYSVVRSICQCHGCLA